MRGRWDDIEILRAVDGLEEQYGPGGLVSVTGREVMDGIEGSRVNDPKLISGFAHELDLARGAGLLTFEVSEPAIRHRAHNTDFYLQNVRRLALTIAGRDRARGRVVRVAVPDPAEDDGRIISHLVLGEIGEAVERQYSREQAVVFLEESGIDLDGIAVPPGLQPDGVGDVLACLERAGSAGRRVLRMFVGRWLSGQFHTGPDESLRRSLLAKLAREGWHVRDGTLVVGGKDTPGIAPGIAVESLHLWVWEAARQLWESGHRRHAVQAAATALSEKVQGKLGRYDITDDKLLQEAFSDKPAEPGRPRLRVPGDPSSPTAASLQRGLLQFGLGCVWVIRNPATHETAEWPPQQALEKLAALSVLARLIDSCAVVT